MPAALEGTYAAQVAIAGERATMPATLLAPFWASTGFFLPIPSTG